MDKRAKARLPSGSKLRWEREGAENTLRLLKAYLG